MEASQLMQCFITEKQSNQINTFDDTKKRAHDSQVVRAKEQGCFYQNHIMQVLNCIFSLAEFGRILGGPGT